MRLTYETNAPHSPARIITRLLRRVAALDQETEQRTLSTDYLIDQFENWLIEELVGYIDDVKQLQSIADKYDDATRISHDTC